MKNLVLSIMTLALVITGPLGAEAQCFQFINYPADTMGWVRYADHAGLAFYNSDTFVITTSRCGENNYFYNSFPVTLFGAASSFSASFDFRLDSLSSCSDGLSFWFLTSDMGALGNSMDEGCALGFPDTTSGFALAMQTTVCMNNIYLLKINSDDFSFCGISSTSVSNANDSIICTPAASQAFLADGNWHHVVVNYVNGYITASFDAGNVLLSGFSPIYGTGHFGFVATNGGGYTRKCLKNIQICAGYGTPTAGADSFGTYVNRLCNGPQIEVHAKTYNAAYEVATYFGDGTSNTSSFSPDLMGGGYTVFSHTYQSPGDYTIREILYNGLTPIDSLHTDYENVFCATLPVKFYYDANGDCLKEPDEPFLTQPVLAEVDSNGIPVDTVSATGGFYYNARGVIGDVYSFKVLSLPGNMEVSCPAAHIVYDSLVPGIFIYPIRYFAINCSSGAAFDLAVTAAIPVTGIHDEWGDVYVSNADCAPMNGTLTLNYSAKYAGTPSQVNPPATSIAGNKITWDLAALSSTSTAVTHLHYQVNYAATTLTVADTVHSLFTVTPIGGDANPYNNDVLIIDTVKSGCDPNEMSVSPAGCIPANADKPIPLTYTIAFTNVGNDTAFNIYVMDTLAAAVDVKSLRVVMASNTMNTAVYQDGPYTIAKFIFPAIDLVDSAACPQCNGAVMFSINTKPGLPDGTAIFNHAGVFFDDNPVVLTNVVESVAGSCQLTSVPAVTAEGGMDIFPNPASGVLNIRSRGAVIQSVGVTDLLGRQAYEQGDINAQFVAVDVSAFPAGVYFLKVNGVSVGKFAKE